jgi:hypothetical protein
MARTSVVDPGHFVTDRIRIRGPVRTADLWIRIRIRILLISSLVDKMPTKNKFLRQPYAEFNYIPQSGTTNKAIAHDAMKRCTS